MTASRGEAWIEAPAAEERRGQGGFGDVVQPEQQGLGKAECRKIGGNFGAQDESGEGQVAAAPEMDQRG